HAAEIVACDLAAERQRLGNTEVEDLHFPGSGDADVPRLEVAVMQRRQSAFSDSDRETVRRFEELAEIDGNRDRLSAGQRLGEHLRQVTAVDIYNGVLKAVPAAQGAEHFWNAVAGVREMCLELRSPLLRLENLAGLPVAAD